MELQDYLLELNDRKRRLSSSRLSNLSDLTPEERRAFREAWSEMDLARRREVMRHLLQLAEDNIELDFDAVFISGLEDPDADVRCVAIQGLWEHEGRDLIAPLINLMKTDSEVAVRAQAAMALGRYVLRAEFQQLNSVDGKRVEEALHAVVDDQNESSEVRARALESAAAKSTAWVRRSIEEAYAGSNRRMRLGAVHSMGRHCDPRWLPILIRELRSDDPEMRFEAATACAGLGGEAAVPELVDLIENEDPEVQEAAIVALGEIGGREAREALQVLLKHAELRLREAALTALEELDFNEDPLGFKMR